MNFDELKIKAVIHAERAVDNLTPKGVRIDSVEKPPTEIDIKRMEQQKQSLQMWEFILKAVRAYNG